MEFINKVSSINRLLLILLLMVASITTAKAQFLEVDTTKFIEWYSDYTMSWKDYVFREGYGDQDKGMALTTVFHSVRGGMIDGKPRFEVKVLFVKEESWTSDRNNIVLLAHEKLHFDLAEVYGRRIRKQIDEMTSNSDDELGQIGKKVRVILDQFKKASNEYDQETNFGNNQDAQVKWRKYIEAELQRLHKYM